MSAHSSSKRLYFLATLALALLLTSLMSYDSNIENDWDTMSLEGEVKHISKRVWSAKEKDSELILGTIVPDPLENWDVEFNKKGFIQHKKCYDTKNELTLSYEYAYSKKNRLSEQLLLDASDQLIEKKSYKYNRKNQCIEKAIYKADESMVATYSYSYNKKGTLNEMIIDVPENSVISMSRYEYLYNKEGQRVGQKNYDRESNRLTQTYEYKYDVDGNRTEHVIINHTGNFSFKWTYEYDAKGNRTLMQRHFNGGSVCKYEYTFDAKGNWIEKVEREKGKVVFLEKREISYF
ncbi:MAG: hypothetical protein GY810_20240 [Aureispira sp.]|nr:hypothetical protein [Aureispira sp.]